MRVPKTPRVRGVVEVDKILIKRCDIFWVSGAAAVFRLALQRTGGKGCHTHALLIFLRFSGFLCLHGGSQYCKLTRLRN